LPELPIQYADFSVWQREWLRVQFFRSNCSTEAQLAGIQTLELPADRKRPAVTSYAGAATGFSVGPQQTEHLKAMSQRQGATLYMTLLAAFQTLLHRYSGQKDIAVDRRSLGEDAPETED